MVSSVPFGFSMLSKIALIAGAALMASPPPPNPVTDRVYLLADGGWDSACLDFADVMRNLPGVVQIGEPTAADALCIDINTCRCRAVSAA
jgi:hypothetical protein